MTIKINIDGTIYEANSGKNLLETCLALGFDVPYFCFHAALGSVGACRLCAVKKFANADDKTGRIIMSCMEPVVDGMIISLVDPEVKDFRSSILESLMTNHPHDCPVCDEGGECHLQDMTVMTGHNYRRFTYKKRTFNNQFLGPFIQHEMNRCIECYRCVRFYKDYAGGKDLDVFGSGNHVYFGRNESGILESEFSGNLAEVCPTGVFTDKTLKKHYTRKWDLTNSPSICTHCSLGCNTIVSERYGTLRRTMNRYNGAINGYFLCDRGRFGYEFVSSDKRIRNVHMRSDKNAPLEIVKEKFDFKSESLSDKKLIGIGSPRASLESNYALSVLVGKENFYHGIGSHEHKLVKSSIQILKNLPINSPSLKEIEKADAVFILGEDITNTAPMMALALRQASRTKSINHSSKIGIPHWQDAAVRQIAQETKSPFFIASPFSTKLDELAENVLRAANDDIARLGFAVASFINNEAPSVKDLNENSLELAGKIAKALIEAENPVIISGIHSGSVEVLQASANIVHALLTIGKKANLSFVFPESNSIGLGLLDGGSIHDAFDLINENKVETLIVLENDLSRRANQEKIDTIFSKCSQVIVLDHLMNQTTMKADMVLPAGTFAESTGTIVNNEGRAQRYYSVFPPKDQVKESWRWIIDLIKASGNKQNVSWENFDDISNAMIDALPQLSKLKGNFLDADFVINGRKISRQSQRFSGRTSMNANVAVSEGKLPQDIDSPLVYSMDGYNGDSESAIIPFYWKPGWNSVQSVNKYLVEPNGSLLDGDPRILLFEPNKDFSASYFNNIPEAFKPKTDEFQVVPIYQIFGSEELSSKAEAIATLILEPFIMMNDKECAKIKRVQDDSVQIQIDNLTLNVKIKTDNSIPEGLIGLSAGFDGMPFINFPCLGKVINEKIKEISK